MTLTQKKKQKFVDWLKSVGVDTHIFQCTVCNSREMAILDEIVFLSTYPNVGIICTRCKNTLLFNATESGVMDK